MKLGNSSRAMGVGAYFLKVFWVGGLRGRNVCKLEPVLMGEQVGVF